ncbi:hypothetical protein [Lunatibacter salilacus]|uniref:hypothetical protein n=1 Tax=Lunatibacter salilacus TaxID=2483804 RepID=UPI00131E4A8A|nr:hypothetical protein [Lunatibacter salilacus]
MKKKLPFIVLLISCILFYWISNRSYALQGSDLETMQLFKLFRGISNLIAFFVPVVLFVFYMLTSELMFTLLDEKFDSKKMIWTIALSFIPVLFNCLVYLIVLYDIHPGQSSAQMLNQQSFIGLGLSDMEEVSYIFWFGFYLLFVLITQHEFGMGYGKAVAVAWVPTLLVVSARLLISLQ